MAEAASMMNTLLQGQQGQITSRQFRKLRTAAGQDEVLDAGEQAVYARLKQQGKLGPDEATMADQFIQAAPGSKVENPEITYIRNQNPQAFDAQVAALKANAKPGDIILWRQENHGIAKVLDPKWSHASAVLPDGKFFDTMDQEGASITSADALVAKGIRRLKPTGYVIARPKTPLTPEQIKQLGTEAGKLQGRGFSFLASEADQTLGCCSKTVYDLFKKIGIDLAPAGSRKLNQLILPPDLVNTTNPVGHIALDGTFSKQLPFAYEPSGRNIIWKALNGIEGAARHFKSLMGFALKKEQEGLMHARLG